MKVSIRSDKKDVLAFLNELKEMLNSRDFDVDKQLLIILSRKPKDKIRYSTPYTLSDLEYDANDVLDRLKELEIRHYSETLFDKEDDKPPLLFVFGKNIADRMVYIKLKMKGIETKKVLCLSFHYAEKEMKFPYCKE